MAENEARENQRADIGVWGPSGAGKTTYLAGLVLALDTFWKGKWRMFATPDDQIDKSDTSAWDAAKAAQEFLEVNSAALDQGIFPRPTGTEAGARILTFEFYRSDSGWGREYRHHRVTFLDAAGELILRPGLTNYFRVLRECKGILCMIDPEITRDSGRPSPARHPTESYFGLLEKLINQLPKDNQGRLARTLAICLTKADLDDEHWNLRKDPEQLFSKVVGGGAYDRLTNMTNPQLRRFFAVSVAGRYRGLDGERPNFVSAGDSYRIANKERWEPFGLTDPLFWLFDQIEEHELVGLPLWQRMARQVLRKRNYVP